ncbi:YitT family protein, partial [Bacillus sp. D-CC]
AIIAIAVTPPSTNMANKVAGLPLYGVFLGINIPILLFTAKVMGKKFFIRTSYANVVTPPSTNPLGAKISSNEPATIIDPIVNNMYSNTFFIHYPQNLYILLVEKLR